MLVRVALTSTLASLHGPPTRRQEGHLISVLDNPALLDILAGPPVLSPLDVSLQPW